MEEITKQFVKTLPSKVKKLKLAYENDDYQMIEVLAHQVKGCAASYGFPALGVIAEKMESLAKDHVDKENLHLIIQAFDFRCQTIELRLKSKLPPEAL